MPLPIFYDDLKIYCRISSTNDCFILHQELNILSNWCQVWDMILNTNKCYSICFYRSWEHTQFTYCINNNETN